MQTECHECFGVIIPPEKVDLTNAGEFKQALQKLYDQGCKILKVDCKRMEMIDSAGLGSLVMMQKKLKERGGELKMININHKYIRHLFEMLELSRIINIEAKHLKY